MKTPSGDTSKKSPPKAGAAKPAKIEVELSEAVVSALDSWIAEQTDRPSREEAVGTIVLEWLATAVTRSHEDFPERRGGDRRKGAGIRRDGPDRRKGDRRAGEASARTLTPDQLNSQNDV